MTTTSGDGVGNRSVRRAEIVAVAAELFAQKGFEGTTVRDIADAAGILSGSLYHHFRSKDQIMEEIFDAYFDELEARMASVRRDEARPGERLALMLRELVLTVDRHPGAARMLVNEWARLRKVEHHNRRSDLLTQQWLQLIEDAREAGELRSDVEPFYLYRICMDAVRGFAGWYRPGRRVDVTQVADAYVTLLMDGLRVRAPGPAGTVIKTSV